MTQPLSQETEPNLVKADFNYMSRDLYWKLYDMQDGFIRWSGYDDANWWERVAPALTTRERKGTKTGRTYRINFETDMVEVIEP